MKKYPETIEEIANYLFDVLDKKGLNKGVYSSPTDVIYTICNHRGYLIGQETLEVGNFVSSGMIRVVYAGHLKFDVLIDCCLSI